MLTFILVTFLIPLLILAADYVQKTELTLKVRARLMFIEPRRERPCVSRCACEGYSCWSGSRCGTNRHSPAIHFRGVCLRLNLQRLSRRYAYAGTAIGIAAVFLVGVIMLFGYV